MTKKSLRIFTVNCMVLIMVLSVATSLMAAKIDTDEWRTDPIEHRYIHGTLGDADFQICLPADWNGKTLIGTRGFSGDEFSNDATLKQIALNKGYVYAASDEGWNRYTIVDSPEDKYFESKARIVQLTNYTKGVIRKNYKQHASRTYIAGASNGGHHTKWMVESYPTLYDGGVSAMGYNSLLEVFRRMKFLGLFDTVADRINDIIFARMIDPDWDHLTEDLDPPLTDEQKEALSDIYDQPAYLRNGFIFNVGSEPGSELLWGPVYPALLDYGLDSIGKLDPHYDPDGDGMVSDDELKSWDPYERPPSVQNDLRKCDLTGNLKNPVIVGHGLWDVVVVPNESRAYKALVEETLGVDEAAEVLRVYLIPGLGHGVPGGDLFYLFVDEGLDALDAWVDYIKTDGEIGTMPGFIIGLPPM